jgi:RHH-type rel operon transcriptional repressor/antitoxin RelB
MLVSIRLDNQMAKELTQAARASGVSKSELVRRSLSQYIALRKMDNRAWEVGKDLFGKYGSGRSDLSMNSERIAREKIHAKKGRR